MSKKYDGAMILLQAAIAESKHLNDPSLFQNEQVMEWMTEHVEELLGENATKGARTQMYKMAQVEVLQVASGLVAGTAAQKNLKDKHKARVQTSVAPPHLPKGKLRESGKKALN